MTERVRLLINTRWLRIQTGLSCRLVGGEYMLVESIDWCRTCLSVSLPDEVEEVAPHVSRHCGFVSFCFQSSARVT